MVPLIGSALGAASIALPEPSSRPTFWLGLACACLLASRFLAGANAHRMREIAGIAAQAWRVLVAWSAVQGLLVALVLATDGMAVLSPRFFALWWSGGLVGLLALHVGAALAMRWATRTGRLQIRLALVGAGAAAAELIRKLRHDQGVVVVGVFDDRRSRIPISIAGCPVLGTLDDLVVLVADRGLDQVVITLPREATTRRLACLAKLRHLPVDVRLSPNVVGCDVDCLGVAQLAGLPLLRLCDRPLTGWAWLAKAMIDRTFAGIVLIATAPLLVAIAVLIRLDSPGPVLFRQRRFGLDNRPIDVWKFRTMYVDCCADGKSVVGARRRDPRVTRLGHFLRRTSLDELPQFGNVLCGQMSLVGPRPHAVAHHERYARLIDGYLARHRVRPGITGWAQVNGLRGEAETLARMQERVRYDLQYIENWSLRLDLRIILRTLLVGFSHPNAY